MEDTRDPPAAASVLTQRCREASLALLERNLTPHGILAASRTEAAARIFSGEPCRRACCSSTVRVRAMNSAAGMPLSDTSPIANHSTPGSSSENW